MLCKERNFFSRTRCESVWWLNIACYSSVLKYVRKRICHAHRKIFGLTLSATVPESEKQAAARKEAAAKIAANRSAIIGDLLKNSGIVRSRTNQYGTTLRVSAPMPCEPLHVSSGRLSQVT